MAMVIGVRFKKAGKVYYFDPCELWPKPGENVVVETARGIEFGEVVTGVRSVPDEQISAPLKKVVRLATAEDVQRAEFNAKREAEAFRVCQEKVARHKLEMKLVSVEYTFDNSKIIFYFTANGRVDFRELVKDLASVFKMRIELRQIGVRDEAKMLGGLGSCGRPICCGAFLGDFQPVSIKMAKEQNLSLNPAKISGLCGRLMCCLKYEQDTYEQTLKRVPRVGKDIVTPDGVGIITEINAIRERVKVRIRTDDDSFDLREYSMDDVRKLGPDDAPVVRDAYKPQDRRPNVKRQPIPEANAKEGEAKEADDKRRRYPHQKAPKNLSTDQFLEKMQQRTLPAERPEAPAANVPEAEAAQANPLNAADAREHKSRRRRGGKGRHPEGGRPQDGEERGTSAPNRPEGAARPSGEFKRPAQPSRAGSGAEAEPRKPVESVAPAAEARKPVESAASAAEARKPVESAAPAAEARKPVESAAPVAEARKPVESAAPAAEARKPAESAAPAAEN